MGRQAKLKARRRAERRRTAAFTVCSPGMLEVLSIGKGDLKIEIGDSNKDRADAQRLIEEMLRKGYTLFVEAEGGPLRVTKFLPDQMAYVVADTPDVTATAAPEPTDTPGPATRKVRPVQPREAAGDTGPGGSKRKPNRTVPVAGSKTTAVGRTAGG